MLVHVHVKFVIRENLAECYQRAEGDSQYLIARRPENIMICAGAGHMVAILGPEHSSIAQDPLNDRMPRRQRMNHGAASRKTQATKSSSSRSAQQDGEAENPRNIVRTCLKTPIEHLCFGARDHEIMRRLDKNGVVRLLASAICTSQTIVGPPIEAFICARGMGVGRSHCQTLIRAKVSSNRLSPYRVELRNGG